MQFLTENVWLMQTVYWLRNLQVLVHGTLTIHIIVTNISLRYSDHGDRLILEYSYCCKRVRFFYQFCGDQKQIGAIFSVPKNIWIGEFQRSSSWLACVRATLQMLFTLTTTETWCSQWMMLWTAWTHPWSNDVVNLPRMNPPRDAVATNPTSLLEGQDIGSQHYGQSACITSVDGATHAGIVQQARWQPWKRWKS